MDEGVHATIKGILHGVEYLPEWRDLSGCVVIEHKFGLVQKERPHYHVWIPGCNSVDGIKGALRSYYDTKIPDLKWNTHANAYYSVKYHNSFDKWLEYVLREGCKSPTIILWNRSEDPPVLESPEKERSIDELIPPVNSVVEKINVPLVTPKKKSKAQAVLFYEYMLDKYYGKSELLISKEMVKSEFFHWAYYGFNDPQAVRTIRTVWYQLNKDFPDLLDKERQGWIARTKIFSDD